MTENTKTIEDVQSEIAQLKIDMAPHQDKWNEWAYGDGAFGKRDKVHFFVAVLSAVVGSFVALFLNGNGIEYVVIGFLLGFVAGIFGGGIVLTLWDTMYEEAVNEFSRKIYQKRKELVELTMGAQVHRGRVTKNFWNEVTFEFDDHFEEMYVNVVDQTDENGVKVEAVKVKALVS